MAFSRTNCPYPSDIPANGSANGSSPREKFLGTSENTRWKLRWVEEVGPQPESRAIANAKWLRDNFCLSSHWWVLGPLASPSPPTAAFVPARAEKNVTPGESTFGDLSAGLAPACRNPVARVRLCLGAVSTSSYFVSNGK